MTTPAVNHPWLDLARRALQEAIEEDLETACRTLAQMATEHGTDCVPVAIQAWLDTVLRQRGYPQRDQPVQLGFVDAGTGQLTEAGEVSAHWVWAGQLLAARAAMDRDMFLALLRSVPDEVWAVRVATVLAMCALNLRGRRLTENGADR